jgi:phospholipase C
LKKLKLIKLGDEMEIKIEKHYGNAVRSIMSKVNPIKKLLIKTNCTVHKYINMRAMEIVKQEGYEDIYRFFLKYMSQLNEGVTFADQDFKSTNHFYHYLEGKGLYGFSNALIECEKYYKMAINYAAAGDISKAVFYFGAACHLIQDSTVPHHVNNRLLKSHRAFEMWILEKLVSGYAFSTSDKSKRYEDISKYIKANALMSNNAYVKFRNIDNTEIRYTRISNKIIPEAESTTAGFMLDFYEAVFKK